MGATAHNDQVSATFLRLTGDLIARAAKSAAEDEVRDFYQFLADWEKGHLEALQKLYGGVREDHWAEGGFSPF